MADLNNGKGKFWGVDSTVNYAGTFTGATKVAEKVKKGGTETTPDGYVVDAIDIDWGGLKLTTIQNGWGGTETVSSTEQNAGKGQNTAGIHSTAYLLNKISDSFTQIYNQIGGSDSAGLRKRIKTVEDSVKEIAKLTPEQLVNIQNDLALIKQELEGTTVNSWTTLVDKLAGLGNGVTVKNYVDTAKSSVIGSSSDAATANTIYGVKKYADNAKTSAINSAASDATTKANEALNNAKSYADTKKTEAINAAASDATTKVNTAKASAVTESKQYTDTEIAKLSKDIELAYIGCNQYTDTKTTEAINAAASDATTKVNTAKASAVTESKQYTDTEIAKLSEDIELAYIGCNQYTDTKIDEVYTTLGAIVDSAVGVRRIEENGEGILEFLNVGN